MPRLSAKTKANRNKKRDSLGRMVPSDEGNATSNNLEDWQVWEEDSRDLLVQAERNSLSAVELQTLDFNTILKDYSKTSRTTKWRKSVEAKKEDPKNTFCNICIPTSRSKKSRNLLFLTLNKKWR
jgi:hypothetical protein